MGKRKQTMLQADLQAFDLEAGVNHAVSNVGFASVRGEVFAGSLPMVVLLGVGPVADMLSQLGDRLSAQLEANEKETPTSEAKPA